LARVLTLDLKTVIPDMGCRPISRRSPDFATMLVAVRAAVDGDQGGRLRKKRRFAGYGCRNIPAAGFRMMFARHGVVCTAGFRLQSNSR
jgi:hypothetical protein